MKRLIVGPRRREMAGIVDWQLAELDRLRVEIRQNIGTEAEHAPALAPEVEHGTATLGDLCHGLKADSITLGSIDCGTLIGHSNPFPWGNPAGRVLLCRIGDAIASRNIHAGICATLRHGLRW
ncbi:hypothetical protein [Rhodovulum euryhalinum]|uniref:Uncharacterized protein n=1 Tax=Rhodovulum euryhalinum TaxID=35805 RepID=A0A4R2KMK9_9RHOB|nr:hypothetical protein [Rhodovulum euryhalinum]TCO71989.1 hypothetical protein EV655_10595 [Rhodovulum euryhalinum]